MKTLALFIGGIALILISATSCWPTNDHQDPSSAVEISDISSMDDNTPTHQIQEDVEERIQENIELIDTCVEKLSEKVEHHKNQLSREALRRSLLLKQDLVRIKTNLEKTKDSLEDVSEEVLEMNVEHMQSELEQKEDELAQIHQELEEWYDNHKH